MEEQNIPRKRTPRGKSKFEQFKEEKLPFVIAIAAGVLILIFIIGSIYNAVERARLDREWAAVMEAQSQNQQNELDAQVAELLQQADIAAKQYDYELALSILDPVLKDANTYPELSNAITTYQAAQATLIAWDDPAQIPNLSFQMLIADPSRAFNDEEYGSSLNRNYITTAEFSAILEQLYSNGYVLVGLEDVYTNRASEDGAAAYMANTIYLPDGKKPIMLTQTNVNYDQYLIDSNKDGDLTDGRGFANKLLIENDRLVSQMVDSTGNTLTGEYDMIPILESFIASHPDFSYRGAKAIIAVSGHEGLFGYRTNNKNSDTYFEDMDQAATVAQWLRDNGYDLACYTYGNMAYGDKTVAEIRADQEQWNNEVSAVLGDTNILVFAQRSDIGDTGSYAGASFEILMDQGYRYYIGFSTDGNPWSKATTQYVRQGRIMVAGATLAHNESWFSGILDPSAVLDTSRSDIPSW